MSDGATSKNDMADSIKTATTGAFGGTIAMTDLSVSPAAPPIEPSVYEKLGVKTVINAAGTLTTLGGSLMPPEVLAALQSAAQHFVDMS